MCGFLLDFFPVFIQEPNKILMCATKHTSTLVTTMIAVFVLSSIFTHKESGSSEFMPRFGAYGHLAVRDLFCGIHVPTVKVTRNISSEGPIRDSYCIIGRIRRNLRG